MSLVLGVDGGGSKTHAALFSVDDSDSLTRISAGASSGSNPYSVGWAAAKSAIQACVVEACSGADCKPDALVIAVAGCGSPDARERLFSWANDQAFASEVWVVPDTEPLLAEAPLDRPVVGLIAGTGSAAIARPAHGVAAIVGGWGYLIDDVGSGYVLGRDALTRVAEIADAGAPADGLTAAVLREAGVEQPTELKGLIYSDPTPRARIAGFAPLVLRLAEAGNPIARGIVDRNVDGLVRLADNAASRAMRLHPQKPALLLAGGVLTRSSFYRDRVTAELIAADWPPGLISAAPDAVIGCARIGVRKLRGGAE